MDFTAIGSLHAYTKNMAMEMKWQQKKSSGDFKADGTKTVEEWLKKQQEEATQSQSTDSKLKAQIDLKLKSGKKLTYEELEYLKNHDPQGYQKAREIQMEREAFERELKKCRTKEEVQRVKLSHAAASMAAVKEADTNPNIPKGQKLALIMQELAKNNALCDAERAFIQSGDYGRLPTENERLKAEEDLKKAEEAEKDMENRTDDTPEEVNDSLNETAAGKAVEEKARAEEKTPSESRIKAAKEIIAGKKPTRMQAEVTPEARKVRRAKAQAA